MMSKVHWESDGHSDSSDARAVYVIVDDGLLGKRIDCPDEIFGNAERRNWARQQVAKLKEGGTQ